MIIIQIIKKYIPYVHFFVYKRELSKNDYLRPLLITIIKSIKKLIKKTKTKVTILKLLLKFWLAHFPM